MDWQHEVRELLLGDLVRPERRCPFCATPLEPGMQRCPRCGEDLTLLLGRPPMHETYYRQALQSYEESDLEQALESLDLCLRLVPDYIPALRLAAGVSALGGRPDVAASTVSRLMALSPADPAGVRLAAAVAAANVTGLRAPVLARTVPEKASIGGNRIATYPAPHARHGGLLRIALGGAMAGVAISTTLRWVISRVYTRPADQDRSGN